MSHCCVCSRVCHHINGPFYCAEHKPTSVRCSCDQGHATFGECMRAKNIRVGYCRSAANVDYTAAKHNERELALYRSARDQGIQPSGTTAVQTHRALDNSDQLGRAFDAAKDME